MNPLQKALQNSNGLLQLFVEDCELRGMTLDSVRMYKSNVKLFLSFREEKAVRVEDLRMDDLKGVSILPQAR